jgi:hypothetical protein
LTISHIEKKIINGINIMITFFVNR